VNPSEKSPGQVAFEAYNTSKGGLTYDGKPIPPWSALEGETGEAVKRAWEDAAQAVLRLLGVVEVLRLQEQLIENWKKLSEPLSPPGPK